MELKGYGGGENRGAERGGGVWNGKIKNSSSRMDGGWRKRLELKGKAIDYILYRSLTTYP